MNDNTAVDANPLRGTERVFAFVRGGVLSGRLTAGARLPGERELCQELNISRPLLREALRSLAMLGILDIQHGRGTFIREPDVRVLEDFLTFSLAQQGGVLDDIINVRTAIEVQAIRLACERATDADLKRLGERLVELTESLHNPETGGAADSAFHEALVVASHSPSLVMVYRSISELLLRSHVERRRGAVSVPGIVDDLVEAHREVFIAITTRDPDAAAAKLREHFAIGDEIRRKNLIAAYTGASGSKKRATN